mmetsp:Transcript_131568/g.281300  ORF Transcript_131568/g.281300 Transcript_131568/m.281300 type:complete len:384 (+) Transcript_131568:691-1842(+)
MLPEVGGAVATGVLGPAELQIASLSLAPLSALLLDVCLIGLPAPRRLPCDHDLALRARQCLPREAGIVALEVVVAAEELRKGLLEDDHPHHISHRLGVERSSVEIIPAPRPARYIVIDHYQCPVVSFHIKKEDLMPPLRRKAALPLGEKRLDRARKLSHHRNGRYQPAVSKLALPTMLGLDGLEQAALRGVAAEVHGPDPLDLPLPIPQPEHGRDMGKVRVPPGRVQVPLRRLLPPDLADAVDVPGRAPISRARVFASAALGPEYRLLDVGCTLREIPHILHTAIGRGMPEEKVTLVCSPDEVTFRAPSETPPQVGMVRVKHKSCRCPRALVGARASLDTMHAGAPTGALRLGPNPRGVQAQASPRHGSRSLAKEASAVESRG